MNQKAKRCKKTEMTWTFEVNGRRLGRKERDALVTTLGVIGIKQFTPGDEGEINDLAIKVVKC